MTKTTTTDAGPTVPLPMAWDVPTILDADGPRVAVRDVVAAACAALGHAPDALRAAALDADGEALRYGEPRLAAFASQALAVLDDLLDAIDAEYPPTIPDADEAF